MAAAARGERAQLPRTNSVPGFDGEHTFLDQFSWRQWVWIIATILVVLFVVPELFDVRIDINHTVKSLHDIGYPGVVAFVAVFTLGQLVRAPGFIFMLIALVTYGRWWGWVVNNLAFPVVLGVQFFVYRKIGGQALTKIRSPLIKKCLAKLDERPLQAVVVLRLFFGMTPMLNMLLAMTSLDLTTYLIGSSIGLLPYVTCLAIFTKPVYNFIRHNVPFFEADPLDLDILDDHVQELDLGRAVTLQLNSTFEPWAAVFDDYEAIDR